MKTFYVSLTLVFASCGQQQNQSEPQTSQVAVSQTEVNQQGEASYARLVKNKEAEKCNEKNLNQLIFSVEEQVFYYCTEDKEWAVIDIKGKDGKDGTNGIAGVAGIAGTNGKDGVNGKDGANGSTGNKGEKGDKGDKGATGAQGSTGYAISKWKDPVTNRAWLIMGWMQLTSDPCRNLGSGAGWYQPTEAQAREAFANGLFDVSGVPDLMLIQPIGGSHRYYFDSNDETVKDAYGVAVIYGQFCVYNN